MYKIHVFIRQCSMKILWRIFFISFWFMIYLCLFQWCFTLKSLWTIFNNSEILTASSADFLYDFTFNCSLSARSWRRARFLRSSSVCKKKTNEKKTGLWFYCFIYFLGKGPVKPDKKKHETYLIGQLFDSSFIFSYSFHRLTGPSLFSLNFTL